MQDIENQKYSGIAMALHWLMAVLIIGNIALAKYVEDLPREIKAGYIYQHKAIGTLVLVLIVWRLIWRLTHAAPALPAQTGPMMRLAAHAGHWTLYAMMVLVPLAGVMQTFLRGRDLGLWFFTIPSPLGENPAVAKMLGGAHDLMGNLLMLAVAGHVLAALYHHFAKRDGLIGRMIP